MTLPVYQPQPAAVANLFTLKTDVPLWDGKPIITGAAYWPAVPLAGPPPCELCWLRDGLILVHGVSRMVPCCPHGGVS